MRVLFVAPNYYPHIGGVERHVREVSLELQKDGHSITIIVPKHDSSYRDFEREGNIEVVRLNKPQTKLFAGLERVLQAAGASGRFLKADIVNFHDVATMWRYGLWIYPILKVLGKKVYITFHGWEGRFPPKGKIVARRKLAARLADGTMCVGHFIEKWYGTRADVVTYGGVHRSSLPETHENSVVFVGRLAKDSGIDCYLRAWEWIVRDHPELRLVICGDGAMKKELEDFVSRTGLRNVEFLGLVENPLPYVTDARVVFTSGYLGILEAFSRKKPVVAVYDNELKKDYLEMMPDSRRLMWIARDSKEVARCVDEALLDREKTERAYRYSLENSWTKVKEDYYRLWSVDGEHGESHGGRGR